MPARFPRRRADAMASMTTAIRVEPPRATTTAAGVGILILVLMAGSLILTDGDALLQVAVMLYVTITALCVARPEFAVFVVLALLLIPLTSVAELTPAAWMDARYLVVAPMAALAVRAARSPHGWPSRPAFLIAGAPWSQRSSAMLRYALPAFLVVGSLSVFWSIDRTATVLRLVAL